MSLFENDQYQWRETYFVLFEAAKRPTLRKLQQALRKVNPRFTLANAVADEHGQFESITVISPDDFAALDICYLEGQEVAEQVGRFVKEMSETEPALSDRKKLGRMLHFNGRFDVLHFEQQGDFEDREPDGMLDPGTLLTVLDALVRLTRGVAVDPQSGTFVQ